VSVNDSTGDSRPEFRGGNGDEHTESDNNRQDKEFHCVQSN